MFKTILAFLTSLYNLLFPTKPTFYHEIDTCTHLLSTTTLTKRAAHNQKLITVFGIQNAFTTISPSVHRTFINHISALLQKSNNDAARLVLASQALEIGREYLESCPDQRTKLNDLVQIMVFRTVLTIFFPHIAKGFKEDGRVKDDKDVLIISQKINSLWYASKSPWEVFAATYFPPRWSEIMRD
jgi:hypothetical protein